MEGQGTHRGCAIAREQRSRAVDNHVQVIGHQRRVIGALTHRPGLANLQLEVGLSTFQQGSVSQRDISSNRCHPCWSKDARHFLEWPFGPPTTHISALPTHCT